MDTVLTQVGQSDSFLLKEVNRYSSKFALSQRESEVFAMLVTKITQSEQIAERLKVSKNTIRNHFQNIFQKTKTGSKTELLAGFIGELKLAIE